MKRAGGWTRRRVAAGVLLVGWLMVGGPQFAWAQFAYTQITTTTAGYNSDPSINPDGARIAFQSWSDPTGGNLDGNMEIFLWTEGGGITQITNTTGGGGSFNPAINADGTRIAFQSDRDLVPGGNPDSLWVVFLWTEGHGFTQLSNFSSGNISVPSINADGTRIAFNSLGEIFLWTEGGGLTQITNTSGSSNYPPSINADGTRIAFESWGDLTGGNTDYSPEIFLWTEGGGFNQITSTHHVWTPEGTELYTSSAPSINGDGTRIAFISDSNLTGSNGDTNNEIFLWTQGSGIFQITNTNNDYTASPSLSADGTRIAFHSKGNLTGRNDDGNLEIFLWTESSGYTQITRSTGGDFQNSTPSINADGTKIAFYSDRNLTGGNDDKNPEIFLAGTQPVSLDLTGAWNSASQSCRKGKCTLKGAVRVVNQGNAIAPASYLRVLLSDDAILDPTSDMVLKESTIKKLKPGRGKTSKVKVTLPPGVTAAGKHLFAVVDARNDVVETDETNNTLMIGLIP